ncbi:integral membrane protein [Mycobacterium shigaense]|uniref:Integral membrane protein n=1 Tax=Mycobacterium shigaense TaxID=722731 RepID=A0A1Z4ED97_9MYCO|nr:integral membrane protein [Mycobacterium shigaense]
MRALAGERTARRAAPFVAVAPTAIWVAVSADGYFAGVAAWGLALLAVAVHSRPRFPAATEAAAGLLLGWAVFLNYGLALLGLPALAVLVSAPGWRVALRVFGPWCWPRWPWR